MLYENQVNHVIIVLDILKSIDKRSHFLSSASVPLS
jgi:hypothetical protein